MNTPDSFNKTKNIPVTLEIRERHQQFYAVISQDRHTLGTSDKFNSYAAARLAGHALIERYENNIRAASEF